MQLLQGAKWLLHLHLQPVSTEQAAALTGRWRLLPGDVEAAKFALIDAPLHSFFRNHDLVGSPRLVLNVRALAWHRDLGWA
ncbi:hypothetical protein OEG84_06500 [Hoeflea sp. G2-23]|uniref:Uncharacterized protein n=1 Tax=Hoeflea algicola TaxID=2983763 RepID=A0ABT3Z6H3_9HYPH|nr:hypothetical protein [Hoeflea algicola]MCY0147368.1 hypothetical protein [Hoeflea algicola]